MDYFCQRVLGISPYRYRELIAHLLAPHGFQEYRTAEPNISMEPANILLARIGKRVDQRVAAQFLRRLRSSPYAARWDSLLSSCRTR